MENKGISWNEIISLLERGVVAMEGEFISSGNTTYIFEFHYDEAVDKWVLSFEVQ